MKKVPFHIYLISTLTLLMVVTAIIVGDQLQSKLSAMSKTYIDEVAYLQSEVMHRTYQQIDINIRDIVYLLENQRKYDGPPSKLSDLTINTRAIIERAFQSNSAFLSLTLMKNNESILRVEYDHDEHQLLEVEPKPIDLNVKSVHGSLHLSYGKAAEGDEGFYFEPNFRIAPPYKMVIQLSTNRFFDAIRDFLEDKKDVGFYLVDKYNGINISSFQAHGVMSDKQIFSLIQERPTKVTYNDIQYRIIYYEKGMSQFLMFTAVPDRVISKQFSPIVNELGTQLLLSFLMMLLSIYILTRLSTVKINQVTDIANKIALFDFSAKQYPKSPISETNQLSESIEQLESTIQQLLSLIVNVASANSLNPLYKTLHEAVVPAYGSSVSLFYVNEEQCIDADTMQERILEEIVNYPVETSNSDGTTTYRYDLTDESGHTIGVLFIRSHKNQVFSNELQAFIEQLSNLAAISLSKYQLLKQQKNLLASFTKTIASAIDAKSPHTGGHCQRVPELTMAMVEAAQTDNDSWKNFNLTEEELEEIFLAAWLHDCGKLTTQDHVIDKSTKLDMFGNRIHEIRTRFEVLKRDVEIKALASHVDSKTLEMVQQQCQAEYDTLTHEFEFVAKLNLGESFVSEHDVAALQRISNRTYVRTFDASIGLSWEERQRTTPKDSLVGIHENVIADKHNHIIKRDLSHQDDQRFTLKAPKHKYNFGEVYNLSITRGTLTPEERFLINDHIIQTIKLLEELPYPNYLASIPLIAGGHHEKMSGDGYPLSIEAEHLPVSARMLAIADIFEALTAKDRPYKTPKTLSQSLSILAKMAKDRHIDADLLTLFISQEIYMAYALKHLNPEQIDSVDHQSLFAVYQS
jgi:HD-GYP domain-containing protein (c-di-GMP phosphodiesterase class II)